MRVRTTGISLSVPGWTRRRWLGASLLGAGGLCLLPTVSGAEATADELVQVRERARKAGLGPFRSSENDRYLGIGDAPDPYRDGALKLCRALSTAYRDHFRVKKFAVNFSTSRLTVVALKDETSYAAFLGEAPGEAVGGHYDLESNRLVIFDFRPGDPKPGVPVERINTFALIHEAAHQLTFNTGLLDRQADVPVAISEGLAMYAELWRPDGRSDLGAINRPRLQVLGKRADQPSGWIPVARLMTDDTLFDGGNADVQLAYAGAWVLVHYLLKTTATLPKFRAYLDAIRPRRDGSRRLADAVDRLGNLDRLDVELRKHASRLIEGR